MSTAYTRSEFQKIAKYHRLLLWSILAAILANIAILALGNNSISSQIYLVAEGFQIFALYKLGKTLKLSAAWMLLFIIGLFIPILGLLILLLMHNRAMKAMRAAGVPVGFMGANPNSITQPENQTNSQNTSALLTSSNSREDVMTSTSEPLNPPNFEPHMPEVDLWEDMEETFALARQTAAQPEQPAIVIVTPGHRIVLPVAIKLLTPEEKHSSRYSELERFVSLSKPQNISAICMTELSTGLQDVISPGASPFTGSRAIPFFGYLMAMGSLGHNVILFEGHPAVLAMGCRDADVLIVDGGMIPFLQSDWLDVAHSVMPSDHKIFIFHRNGEIHQV
jgi:hypothetical protein